MLSEGDVSEYFPSRGKWTNGSNYDVTCKKNNLKLENHASLFASYFGK